MKEKSRACKITSGILIISAIAFIYICETNRHSDSSKKELALTSEALLQYPKDNTKAFELAVKAYETSRHNPSPITSRTLSAIGYSFRRNPERLAFLTHKAPVNHCAFSPDGNYAASASDDGTITLLNIITGKEIILQHGGKVSGVTFSQTGTQILSYSWNMTGKLWSMNGKMIARLNHDSPVMYGMYLTLNNETQIITGTRNGEFKIWRQDGTLVKAIVTGQNGVSSIDFCPANQLLIMGAWDGSIKLFNPEGDLLDTVTPAPVYSVSFSHDGTKAIAACSDKQVYIYNIEQNIAGKFTLSRFAINLDAHDDTLTAALFAPDGHTFITATRKGLIRCFDLKGFSIRQFAHLNTVTSLSFNKEGKKLLSSSTDGTVKLWDYEADTPLIIFDQFNCKVNHAVMSENATMLLTGTANSTSALWDLSSKYHMELRHQEYTQVNAIDFSPDGVHAITGARDNFATIWNLETGTQIKKIMHAGSVEHALYAPNGQWAITLSNGTIIKRINHLGESLGPDIRAPFYVTDLIISPDNETILASTLGGFIFLWSKNGQLKGSLAEMEKGTTREPISIVSCSEDGKFVLGVSGYKINIWSSEGKKVFQLKHDAEIKSAVFAPGDNSSVLAASADGKVRLWYKGNIKKEYLHTGMTLSASFSKGGDRIIVCNENKAVLWSKSGERVREFMHTGRVLDAAFSPTEPCVVTVGADQLGKLWNRDGELLAEFTGHHGDIVAVKFGPRGNRILTIAAGDATAKVWTTPEAIFQKIQNQSKRTQKATYEKKAAAGNGISANSLNSNSQNIAFNYLNKKINIADKLKTGGLTREQNYFFLFQKLDKANLTVLKLTLLGVVAKPNIKNGMVT